MTRPDLVCVGYISGAHGIKGLLRVRSLTDVPEDLFSYQPLTDADGTARFVLQPVGIQKDHFLVRMDGITDRSGADAMRGVKLFAARASLPALDDGSYYETDLIGLAVRDKETQADLGSVLAVHDYGAGTFLEIKPAGKASFMLPFRDAFVPDVDIAGGFITAIIPPDWLTQDKPPAHKAKRPPKA